MDNEQPKPVKVIYYWKYIDEALDQIRKTGMEGRLAYSSDSDAVTPGVQNNFKIYDIPYKSTCPGVDIFAVGITSSGEYNAPGFWPSGNVVIVKETGGIDSVETSFEVLSDSVSDTLVAGDYLETPSGEIMRVESVTPGTPNDTLTVERGAHATTAASVLINAELSVLTPRCGMERIILTGDTSALAAPVLDSVNGVGEGILLQWSHSYTGDNLSRLSHFKVYYSDAAAINISNALTYDGTFEVAGNQTLKVFNPLTSTLPEVDTTFYFVITAWSQAIIQSLASNERSGKAYGSFQPNPNGPFTPEVDLVTNGRFRLLIIARKPTGTNSALGVADASSVYYELYFAATGLGNPTAGNVDGNQTQVGTFNDTAVPYQYEKVVDGYGFGEYWARARITDGASQVGSYGLSGVLTLSDETNTTDTGVATGVNVDMVVLSSSSTAARTSYIVGVNCSGNFDSAVECQIAFRVNGVGTFAPTSDTPFTGATAPESTPAASGNYPALFWQQLYWDRSWEVTARIRNAYDWTNWITPEAITLSKTNKTVDTGVCVLAEFGAWTQANPYPGATPGNWPASVPEPGGEQVTFTYKLPTGAGANSTSVWAFGIEGTKAASFPVETVLLNKTAKSMVAKAGTYEVTITGYTATLNEFADKFLRKGLALGANTTDILQVFRIASNTAGNPFDITLTGTESIRNLSFTGAVIEWEIVTKPIWELVDFYLPVRPEFDHLGALAPSQANFMANVTGLKFRMHAHNLYGLGAYRESNTTVAGSVTPGVATYKSISGIDTVDIKPRAVTPATVVVQLIPIGHTVTFTATNYRSFSWAAGTVYFADGTSVNLSASSSGNLSTDTAYWVSFDPGSPGAGLTITTSVSTALAGGKVILAIAQTTSVVTEFCTIIPRWGSGINIGAQNIVCENLSAISANLGTMTAGIIIGGTIKTAASGARLQFDTTDGLRNIDAASTVRIQMPAASSKIALTSGYNATTGVPEAGWIEFVNNFHLVGGVGFLPTTDGAGNFLIGSSGAYHTKRTFNSIEVIADNDLYLAVSDSAGNINYISMQDGAGIVIDTHDGDNLTLQLGTGSNLLITGSGSNINLSAAGNLTLKGTYVSLIDGGATSYLKMRRATDGATRYLSIGADDSLVVGSSAPA